MSTNAAALPALDAPYRLSGDQVDSYRKDGHVPQGVETIRQLFTTISEQLEPGEVFAEAVKGANKPTIQRSFRSLSDTCKHCHKKFRKKKE